MEVDHDSETHVMGSNRLVDHVGLTAPSSRGIHPNPQPDGIDALPLKDRQAVLLNPGIVVKLDALGFHLGKPAHIRTPGEGTETSREDGRKIQGEKETTQ